MPPLKKDKVFVKLHKPYSAIRDNNYQNRKSKIKVLIEQKIILLLTANLTNY